MITTQHLKLTGNNIHMEDNRCAKTSKTSCGFHQTAKENEEGQVEHGEGTSKIILSELVQHGMKQHLWLKIEMHGDCLLPDVQ